MSDNNATPADTNEPQEVGLDDFEKDFFSAKEPAAPEVQDDSTPDPVDTVDTPEDDGEKGANDPPVDPVVDEENDDNDDDDGKADPTPPKKTRAQERIEELNAKYREEERQKLALEAELAKLKLESSNKEQPEPEPKAEDAAPHWDDVDEKGEKKYPLGQFDPQFNADLVRHTMQEERKALEAEREQQKEAEKASAVDQALQSEWEQKLAPAQERYPDFQEKGQELITRFDNLDQGYAKYLTQTIQRMDNGTDVLYHLASNPDLAQEIVNQGPAMASVALGRLSVQFESKETPAPKQTSAPPPPPRARGSAPPKKKDPLNNLDDFEKDFFR